MEMQKLRREVQSDATARRTEEELCVGVLGLLVLVKVAA
jgi:hypothetical protein